MQLTAALILTICAQTAEPLPDWRNIRNGYEIPDEGYCDQPYVVIAQDGTWVCTMTTGPGEEGGPEQHVVSTFSTDQGRTWSPLNAIEPHGPPEASWVMPLILPSGRIYAFYVYNDQNLRSIEASTEYARNRVDTLGAYVFRYSDDHGRTWSPERHTIPVRDFDIDRDNPYEGRVRFFWGVGKPVVAGDTVFMGLAKVAAFGQGFIERSEGFFLKSPNILHEPDPDKLIWETLPEGRVGLRAPDGPIAEEHNLTFLKDGTLYCTYRTTQGHPCHAYSRDAGKTWTPPAYMTYAPDGPRFKHPRAANFVRRFSNGKYLYWFHNHGGKDYNGRNPAWVCGGVEKDGAIHWTQPEILLYDPAPDTRMSYPDFIEQDGRYWVTETQKSIARVHEIPAAFLEKLWNQFDLHEAASEGVLAFVPGQFLTPGALTPLPRYCMLRVGGGLSIEYAFTWDSPSADTRLLSLNGRNGASLTLGLRSNAISLEINDGERTEEYRSRAAILPASGWCHVVVTLDRAANIATFVVNGLLDDGGTEKLQGWLRMNPSLKDCDFGRHFTLAKTAPISPKLLRIYERALMTSEAVGNYRALRSESQLP